MPRWSDGLVNDEELWGAYEWPDSCLRVNFVVSLDGHIKSSDGLSAGLSSPEDRRIFHMLRAGCDAILVGAGTARAENYGPVRLKSEWTTLRQESAPPTLVMVSASGKVPDIAGAVTVDGTDLAALKDTYPRILCEGGPHLFATLVEQGLVDQIALSISGRIGGSAGLLGREVTAHFTPIHAHAAEDTLFTVWSRR